MNVDTVFILAHGQGSGWECDDTPAKYKQLIQIDGMPNIQRTILLLDTFNARDIIMVAPPVPEFFDVIPMHLREDQRFTHHSMREPTGNIITGIMAMSNIWKKLTVPVAFLLGDVVFSRNVIQNIMTDVRSGFSFFGRFGSNPVTGKQVGEIFAITVGQNLNDKDQLFNSMLPYLSPQQYGGAKLWFLYDACIRDENVSFIDFYDYTDDIDSMGEYNQFYKKLDYAARNDV